MKLLALLALASVAHAEPTLIVGKPSGLFVVRLDGSELRKVSATPAAQPRVSADGKRIAFLRRAAVVMQGPRARQTYDQIRVVDIDGTREKKLADVPTRWTGPCRDENEVGHEPPFFLYSQRWFSFDDRGRTCVALTDLVDEEQHAGDNIAVRVEASVSVSRIALGGDGEGHVDHCGPAPDAVELEHGGCNAELGDVFVSDAPPRATSPKPLFELVGRRIVRIAGRKKVARLPLALNVGRDRIGTFVVVDDGQPEEDYPHPSAYLFDEATGALRAIVAGAWPSPLAQAQLRDGVRTASGPELGVDVIGEALLFTQNDDAPGGLVVRPGAPMIDLGGDVARRTKGAAWEPEATEEERFNRGWKPR